MDQPTTTITVEDAPSPRFSLRKLFSFMGPGLLMSIAYVDPGNLESDLQVGASAGYVLLWLLLFCTGLGLVVQMQAAKLGVATGKHLAEHCRAEYPPVPRIALWIMTEIAIIGSDIQEVIGSAIALALLSNGHIPLWAGVLVTAVDSFLLLFIERLGVRWLEGLFGILIGTMVVSFGVMFARADVPGDQVALGFIIPRLPSHAIPQAVALVGSLIMPHNIFLHSALVQSRQLASPQDSHKREAIRYFTIESAFSLVAAIFINMFVISVFAKGFYGREDIGLQNAGEYLGKEYGTMAAITFGLGLLAAGQSSTMTGTYTGQFVMSGFLDLKVSAWMRVGVTRLVAIAPTLAVALIYRDSSHLDDLNQMLNLLQSIQLPFALIPVLAFNCDARIMGNFVNPTWLTVVCVATAFSVITINVFAVVAVAGPSLSRAPWGLVLLFSLAVVAYLTFISYLLMGPERAQRWFLRLRRCVPCDPRKLVAMSPAVWSVEDDEQGLEDAEQNGDSGAALLRGQTDGPGGGKRKGRNPQRVPLLGGDREEGSANGAGGMSREQD